MKAACSDEQALALCTFIDFLFLLQPQFGWLGNKTLD